MKKDMYEKIEKYMLSCMKDSAHDSKHIYRVLYYALEIAKEYDINKNVLIAASLLHDIGREKQLNNPECDHAVIGADMAYEYLTGSGWTYKEAEHVRKCIVAHRFRNNNMPKSMEAKILYDADKLDVTGTMGIARTLAYKGITSGQLYCIDEKGDVSDGKGDEVSSFFHEYNWKLKNIYDRLFTKRAREIAEKHRKASIDFYKSMFQEADFIHKTGLKLLGNVLE